MTDPMTDEIRRELLDIAGRELDWDGPLPDGELNEEFDSLQLMTLVVAVEDRFRIILEAEDEEEIRTVEDLVAVIGEKRG